MNRKEVVELMVLRLNRLRMNNGFFGATDGTVGNINVLQRDMNRALEALHASGDTAGLGQMAATLHVYGNLTDTEYEQIMETLDGEK